MQLGCCFSSKILTEELKNNLCVSLNNDFCYEWGNSSQVKTIAVSRVSRLTKIVIQANDYITLFYVMNTQIP